MVDMPYNPTQLDDVYSYKKMKYQDETKRLAERAHQTRDDLIVANAAFSSRVLF